MKNHLLQLIRHHSALKRAAHARADYYEESKQEGYRNAYLIIVNAYLKHVQH